MGQNLSNGDIYRKTLTFSIRRLIFCVIYIIILAALTAGGFIIADKFIKGSGMGLVGMGIGFVIALVLIGIISHFFMYVFRAGQIAVMTKAVTEDCLPDNCWEAGKAAVKERFATVAIYYAATSVIKGLFRELGNAITKIGESVGGESGNAVGSAISIVINTIVEYLCDCCLGYVFYRKDESAFKATCEGAVTFFKYGKTFLKNMGRIFGMGLASLILIGGAFFGVFFLILGNFSSSIAVLANELSELRNADNQSVINFLSDPGNLTIAIAAVLALIVWSIIHGTFIKPFVLVGVLRNYMTTAIENIPDASEFGILEKHSKKFKKYKREHAGEL